MPDVRVAAFLTLLLLAAGNAFAHGGHADEQGAAAPEQAARVFAAPCGELPGHACSCGNLALCSAAAKPAAIAGAFAWFSLAAGMTRPLGHRAPQPSPSPTYRAPARAPPLFS
jgi:hypothetical protein